MGGKLFRATTVLALVGLAAVSAALIVGAERSDRFNDDNARGEPNRPHPEPAFQQCPSPPCMGPCVLNGEPEVLCKGTDGTVAETTYFCCCCGSGSNQFQPL